MDGKVLKKLPQFTTGMLNNNIQGYTGVTPYMVFDNLTIYFLCILILLKIKKIKEIVGF